MWLHEGLLDLCMRISYLYHFFTYFLHKLCNISCQYKYFVSHSHIEIFKFQCIVSFGFFSLWFIGLVIRTKSETILSFFFQTIFFCFSLWERKNCIGRLKFQFSLQTHTLMIYYISSLLVKCGLINNYSKLVSVSFL